MARPKVTDEHKKKLNRERVAKWRKLHPERAEEIRMRHYVKKALLLMQQQSDLDQNQREGVTE